MVRLLLHLLVCYAAWVLVSFCLCRTEFNISLLALCEFYVISRFLLFSLILGLLRLVSFWFYLSVYLVCWCSDIRFIFVWSLFVSSVNHSNTARFRSQTRFSAIISSFVFECTCTSVFPPYLYSHCSILMISLLPFLFTSGFGCIFLVLDLFQFQFSVLI